MVLASKAKTKSNFTKSTRKKYSPKKGDRCGDKVASITAKELSSFARKSQAALGIFYLTNLYIIYNSFYQKYFQGNIMSIAKDGRAIIEGEIIPAAEVKVVKALYDIATATTTSEVESRLLSTMSYNSIHTLLRRLEKRKLVTTETKVILILGGSYKRVFWSITEIAKNFFDEEKKKEEKQTWFVLNKNTTISRVFTLYWVFEKVRLFLFL